MTNQIDAENTKTWKHRADNRERLIAAGYKVLSEKGLEATTVKEIAHAAGVSPGLFHYYFASKEALLLAVLQEAGTRYGSRMRQLRATVPAEEFPGAALAAEREQISQEPEWYRLRYELFALSLRNPAFLPELGELLGHIRLMFARALQNTTKGNEIQMQALASVVMACFDGLALQQLAQPDADLSGAYQLLLEVILGTKSPAA